MTESRSSLARMIADRIPGRQDWIVLLCGMTTFLQVFDGTALTPALPAMARDFSARPESSIIIVACYLVAGTAILPFSGWLVDHLGGRAALLISLAIFAFASVACGLGGTLIIMISGRLVQGFASGIMIPAARSVALHSTPTQQTVRTMALLSTPVTLALILGPPLGGMMTAWLSWKSIFLVNVPFCSLIGVALARLMPSSTAPRSRPFDWAGGLLLAGAITAITGPLAVYPDLVSCKAMAIMAMLSLMMLLAYLRRWRVPAAPLLDLDLFRQPIFRTVVVAGLFARSAARAAPILSGLLLEVAFGFSPQTTGGLLMMSAVGSLFARPVITRLIRFLGFRLTLAGSTALTALSLAVMIMLSRHTPMSLLVTFMLAQGFFRSVQNIGLSSMNLAGVPRESFPDAIAIATLCQQLSGNLGTALAVMCLASGDWAVTRLYPGFASQSVALALLGAITFAAVPAILTLETEAGGELV